ncbi:hypothetical protein FIBSPDRAFT_940110 [Athelia psychrophila]|uniref:Uncharacterized protein n=1 Tax=Athelia psychrophila TaxID=1759441 RepID=A0A167WKP6_9AGAM|nr:hypothetical protein FIBSPDRAFT_940110 [Fibularhizoctonia sp. CBS 109695]
MLTTSIVLAHNTQGSNHANGYGPHRRINANDNANGSERDHRFYSSFTNLSHIGVISSLWAATVKMHPVCPPPEWDLPASAGPAFSISCQFCSTRLSPISRSSVCPLVFLTCYLGTAYIMKANEGFYSYNFLDSHANHALLAAYAVGIGIGIGGALVFAVVKAIVTLL